MALWPNVALTKFVLKSISQPGDGPDRQVWAISGPRVVRDGPDRTPDIRFILLINVALEKIVLKSISEAGDGPDGQVWAISGRQVVQDGTD